MSCKPESETPETDAVYGQFINTVTPDVIDFHALLKAMDTCARSLERRLRLAQTEIKWYMRVEEELRAELDESRKNIGPAAYGKNQDGTYNICLGYHPEEDQYEWLVVIPAAEAQARIAELEKALARAREYVSGFDPEIHLGAPEVLAVIDAALKDRA